MNTVTNNTLDEDAAVQLKVQMEGIVMEFLGLNANLAAPFAASIVDGMRRRMGGNRVYIPAAKTKLSIEAERSARDREIAEMFNGRNLKEVMAHFGVSRRSVYRAVERTRKQTVPPTA